MFAMAEDTGGEAFVNTNGLTQAVTKAVEDGSNYYTLTYSPTNVQWDGRFRAIKVKVVKPSGTEAKLSRGVLRGRSQRPEQSGRGGAVGDALSGPANTMVTAMMHGGPDPAEISVQGADSAGEPRRRETALAPDNLSNPDPKVKVAGSVQGVWSGHGAGSDMR